jgi:hypothetical protein
VSAFTPALPLKANPGILIAEKGNIQKDGEQGNGQPKPKKLGIVPRNAWHWDGNEPVSLMISLYLCPECIWGTAGDDFLDFLYSWDHLWIKIWSERLKTGLPCRNIPTKIDSSAGGWEIWCSQQTGC